MLMRRIYKSNKYRSMIRRISQKPRNDRKIKTVKFLFLLSIYTTVKMHYQFRHSKRAYLTSCTQTGQNLYNFGLSECNRIETHKHLLNLHSKEGEWVLSQEQ